MHGVHDVTCKARASVVPLCVFVFAWLCVPFCLAMLHIVL